MRNAVHEAKEKVQRYRRHSVPAVSCELTESAQPPPYNPHYPQQRSRRSSVSSEFVYPPIEYVAPSPNPPDYFNNLNRRI